MGLYGNKGILRDTMEKIASLFLPFLFMVLVAANTACAKQTDAQIRTKASYDRLCMVYEKVKSQPLSAGESADMLVRRLRIGVPELDEVVGHIFNADRSDVYDLYKQSAEYAIGKPWDCPAIKAYYQIKWKESSRVQ